MDDANALPTVQSHSSAARFLERMEPLFMAQETRYGLMLGSALYVLGQPEYYGKNPPYFAIAEDRGGVAAAAMMTPPYGIVTYSEREDPYPGLRAIANDLASQGWRVPTVNGPEPICTYFAQIWSELTGIPNEVGVSERVFELRQVIHPTYSQGHMRYATLDDLELLAQWFVDFTVEALRDVEEISLSAARERLYKKIEEKTIYVWDDREVVCLVGTSRPTATGIAIGPVYTPPHLRGRGYASSCVAQVSQRQLDSGKSFCTLFTDLANPTSNHIYQAIGYRPVCDYTVYTFKN